MNVEKVIKTTKEIPIESRTLIHIELVNNMISETLACVLKPFEMSIQQFNVLRILRGQKGQPANLSTLNERMVTKMSNTTRLVDKLLLKDYVSRTVCPSNRRKIEIRITCKGEEILKEMDIAIKNAENKLVAQLSAEELQLLNHLLDKF